MAQIETDFIESCDCKDLLPLAKCFTDRVMSPNRRKAVQIVLMNYIIATLKSADIYSIDELVAISACCECNTFNEDDWDAMFTYLLWASAMAMSDSAPDNEGELIDEACKLDCGRKDLRAFFIPLWCKLFNALNTATNRAL